MRRSTKPLALIAAGAFALQAVFQSSYVLPTWLKNYSTGKGVIAAELSPDQILLQLFGFREFLAGILWVKADSFFDSGNYDAILPIIRLCTILDPKQIDIYAVGMWHIGYNFTDEEQRSDRRYIPSALALGREGAKQNPNTYEMYFETGWMWYHKIDDDYDKAVEWLELASQHEDIPKARRDLLAKAYERAGRIEEQLDLYYQLFAEAEKAAKEEGQFANTQIRDTIESNLNNTMVRMVQRGFMAQKQGWYAQGDYDTKPPFDVGLSAKVTVLEKGILRVEGTWNVLPVGTRIRFVLRDMDYPDAVPGGMVWDKGDQDIKLDPPKNITFLQDQLFVKNRRFNKRIDMSKDPTMYPFLKDEYLVEFYYNPRSAAPHMQDKFGWNGEGITDANYLNTEIRPGTRVIYATLKLTKDQIRREGEWRDRVPVVKTPNYKEAGVSSSSDDLISVPSIRGN